MRFADGDELAADLVVFSAGIRPRDELARAARPRRRRARRHRRRRRAAAPPTRDVYAIGECALRRRPDLRPGRARLRDGRGGRRPAARRRRRRSPAPTCPPSSSCSASTWPASATPSRATPGARRRSPSTTRSPASTRSSSSPTTARTLLGGILVGDAVGVRHAARRWRERHAAARRTPSELILPGGARARRRRRRRRAARRRPGLLVQQRHQGRDLRGHRRRQGSTDVGGVKACTKAGTGCGGCVPLVDDLLKAELTQGRRRGQQRTCASTSPYSRQELFDIVRVHGITHVRRAARQPRHAAAAARSASRRWPRSSPRLGNELHPRRRAGGAAGHQRPLPRQHPARRHLLGRAAHPRRRDHARQAHRSSARWPATSASTPRSPAASASTCSAPASSSCPTIWQRAGRRRLRVGPRLRQGAAHGEVVRRAAPGAATACRTRSAWPSSSSCATGACARRTSSSRRSPAAPASAPRRRARTSASSPPRRAGTSTSCGNGGMQAAARRRCSPPTSTTTTLIRYIDRFLMFYIRTADRLQRTATWLEQARGRHRLPARRWSSTTRSASAPSSRPRWQRHVDTYECEWKATHRRPGAAAALPHLRQRRRPDPSIVLRAASAASSARRSGTRSARPVEAVDGGHAMTRRRRVDAWVDVCALDDIAARPRRRARSSATAGRGVPARRRRASTRSSNFDPFSGAFVLSRGIVGRRATCPRSRRPIYKQSFDLRTGECLDDPVRARCTTFPVRVGRRPGAGAASRDAAVRRRAASSETPIDRCPRRAGRPHRRRALRAAPRRASWCPSRPATTATSSRSTRPRPGQQYGVRGRPRRLHRLQGVRHRLPQPQRSRRRRDVAAVGAPARRHAPRRPSSRPSPPLPPLRRPGVPERLPGRRLREGSGHRHRRAPRRPVHRLQLLHAHVPLRGARSTTTAAASCASATCAADRLADGRGAGLRAGAARTGHRASPSSTSPPCVEPATGDRRSCRARRPRRSPCRRRGTVSAAAGSTRPAARPTAAGAPPHAAHAAGGHARAHPAVGRRVRGRPRAACAGRPGPRPARVRRRRGRWPPAWLALGASVLHLGSARCTATGP